MLTRINLTGYIDRLRHEAFTGGQSLWRKTQRWRTIWRYLLAADKSFHEAQKQDLVQFSGCETIPVCRQAGLTGVTNDVFFRFPGLSLFLGKKWPKPKPKSQVALGFYPLASPFPGPTQCHFAQILAKPTRLCEDFRKSVIHLKTTYESLRARLGSNLESFRDVTIGL